VPSLALQLTAIVELLEERGIMTRSEAMRRERELKTGKGREWTKHELLRGC
jgi:predicted GIY-YIG superfamily endonuclease